MDTFKKNPKAVAIVAGAIAAALGLYALVKKATREDPNKSFDNSERQDIEPDSPPKPTTHVARIKIERENGYLTLSTISQIFDTILKLASPKFVALTLRDREERRANKSNLRKYLELWDSYSHQLEDVIEDCQRELLAKLGVSTKEWEDSNSFYMSQMNPEIMMLHASLPQKLKLSLKPTKKLTKEEFKHILKTEVELLDEEIKDIDAIRSICEHPEEIAPILQNRVYDSLYESYGVEEQDIYIAMREYMMDTEIQEILGELQKVTMKLVPR